MHKEAIKYNLLIFAMWVVAIFISLGIATNCILITLNKPIYVTTLYEILLTIYNINRLCFQIGISAVLILLLILLKWLCLDDTFSKFSSLKQTWQLRRYIRQTRNSNFNSKLKYDFIKIND